MNKQVNRDKLSLVQRQKLKKTLTLYFVSIVCLWLIILSFTPFTYHLDEIKVSMTYFFGPWLLCLALYFLVDNHLNSIPRRILLPLLGYFAVLFISLILSEFKWVGWLVIGQHFALAGFFVAFALCMTTRKIILNFLLMFVWIAIVTTVFGLLQYTGLFSLIKKWFFPGDPRHFFDYFRIMVGTFSGSREMFSTILNRDFYSGFLVMLLPLSLAGVLVFDTPGKRILSFISVILSLGCIYLAFSKDSFAATILVLFLFVVIYKNSIHSKAFHVPHLGIWILGIVLILGTMFFFTRNIVIPKLKGVGRSFRSRSIIWHGAWEQFLDRPIFGNGPGTFRIYFPKYRREDYMEHDISNVTLYSHNRYLDLLCETGIFGLLTYLWFMVAVLLLSFTQIFRGRDPTLRVIQLGFATSIIGLLFTIFFSPSVRWVVIGTTYWSLLGGAVGTALYEFRDKLSIKREPSTSKKPFIPRRQLLTAVLAGFIIISIASSAYAIRYFLCAYQNNRGVQLLDYGYYGQARDYFVKALKYNPTFITSYYKLGHCYSKLGQVDEALETYETLARYAPDYAEIHFNLGVLYLEQDQIEAAREHIEEAARQSIKEQTRLAAGKIFFQYGRLEEAKKYFLDALAQNPESDDARELLVNVTKLLNQPEEMETYLLSLYNDFPDREKYTASLIRFYVDREEYNKLVDFLKHTLENNPLSLEHRFMLMSSYYEISEYEEALEQGIILEKLGFSPQRFVYLMGRTHQRLGNREKMNDYFEKTIAMDNTTSEAKTAERLLLESKRTTK